MAIAYPHRYHTELSWKDGRRGLISAPPRPDVEGGAPPEFGGTDEVWSPEHLLLSSASLCLMLTFMALAERAKLAVESYRSSTEGVLDRTAAGLAFTRVAVRVELRSPEQERAEALLLTAKKHCIVSNSLKAPIEVEVAAGAP